MSFANILEYIKNINFANPTWDLFVWLFFVIGSFIYGFVTGKDRVVVMMVSVYISFVLVKSIPYIEILSQRTVGDLNLFKILSFFVLFLLLFALFDQFQVFDLGSGLKDKSIFKSVFFSVLHTGLIIAIVLSFLSDELLNNLSFQTKTVFLSPYGFFAWTVLPVLALMIFSRKKSDK